VETLTEVNRLRPAYSHPYLYLAGSLAFLGRLDEAGKTLDHLRTQFPDDVRRLFQARPPWIRHEDWLLRDESLRLAAGEPA
jgi:adenylate cyclase